MRISSALAIVSPRFCASLLILLWSLATVVAPSWAADPPASVSRSEVFKSGTEGYHTFRIPSIIRAADGSLFALCEGRKQSGSDTGDIDVVMRRSVDNGDTWGDLVVVWDEEKNTAGNPCPVVDQTTGDIHLLLTWNKGSISEKNIATGLGEDSRRVFVSRSSDNGQTWSTPRDITRDVKDPAWSWYATGPGAGIQIAEGPHRGRLVIPCDHKRPVGKVIHYHSHVIYSDDQGETWKVGNATPEKDVNECEVVELSGGRLMLNMRNYDRDAKTRQVAFSDDGGQSWTDQRHDPALVEPICQASIRRMNWPEGNQPGVLLFSNPAHPDKRQNMTVRASLDDGRTWQGGRVLYSGSSAYSCLVALPESQVGCLYEVDNYGRILFDRFSLDWVVEGSEGREDAPSAAK
jgi:sialidase-1